MSAELLDDTVTVFRQWLHLDDAAPLYVVAAAVVANLAPGDPVWLLMVAPPSTGKTELLQAIGGLDYVHSVATLTEASLLSGTPKTERTKGATGGVLRQVGTFGVLLAKDFTSVLTQNKDTRGQVLAALREVYDGTWDRAVGTDGGRVLHWAGKCGFLGGVTPVLDRHHAVISGLGDRFVLLRLPDVDAERTGRLALAHVGFEQHMRQELASAMVGLIEGADVEKVSRPLLEHEERQLIALATYTVRARTGVERDGYTNELLVLPQIEGPGRFVTALRRMLGGLEAIGCTEDVAWSVVRRIAMDCVPAIRTALADALLGSPTPLRTSELGRRVGMVTKTAHRHLEDLSLLGLADRERTGTADRSPDLWSSSAWLRQHWPGSRTEIPSNTGGGLVENSTRTTDSLSYNGSKPVEEAEALELLSRELGASVSSNGTSPEPIDWHDAESDAVPIEATR
jgi:hypothetical protein